MGYEYVKRAYGVNPIIGQRIKHHANGREGVIAREKPSQAHYVQVRFDGDRHALPCHPTEMDYQPPGDPHAG